MKHAAEFRRCLEHCDVVGIRRLWKHVSPHLPQPSTHEEALFTIHLARTKMKRLHPSLRQYSAQWLKERVLGRAVSAVGISVIAPRRRRNQAEDLRGELKYVVSSAIKEGVCIDTEAAEVKRRMMIVRDKAY